MFGYDIEWTTEEIDILNKNYSTTNNIILSQLLSKSRGAIVNKANYKFCLERKKEKFYV